LLVALFVIERNFAERLALDARAIEEFNAYNASAELRWLFSFLSADKKKSYCLYEAADPSALIKQAEDLGIPADAIVEVSEVNPEMFTTGASVSGHNGV
jgi:hypothetical protein